jgi:membrane protein implicated in regulation of membrane protease activity
MVPYYVLVNPVLEEVHWAPLREHTPVAHVAFAGYHVMLLSTLLAWPWLAVVFAALAVASIVWKRMSREARDLVPAILSHAAADLGIIVVAALAAFAH